MVSKCFVKNSKKLQLVRPSGCEENMHPDAFKQLKTEILERLEEMFRSGATVEQMLGILEVGEANAKLYRFYLEATCGEPLEGSIFLITWNRDDQKNRAEVLVYLEDHLQRIRKRNANALLGRK